MAASLCPAPDRVLEQLHQHLRRALTEHSPNGHMDAFLPEAVDPSDRGESRTLFRVEGPAEVSVRGELELFPIGEEACDVRAETKEGPSRHFTCNLPGQGEAPNTVRRVAHSLATFLLGEIERRRSQGASQPPAPSELPPHVPLLVLDKNGTIQDLTGGARRILEYSSGGSLEPNFFAHVHGQHVRRVMQDLAHMVSHRNQSARWLLRLRTGNHRWHWYRATAENRLDHADGGFTCCSGLCRSGERPLINPGRPMCTSSRAGLASRTARIRPSPRVDLSRPATGHASAHL